MTRKITFFEGWSWFKFNNLGLALGTNLIFYTSVAKGLKLKVRRFWGPNHTSVEVTGEKLVGGCLFPPSPILNRVKHLWRNSIFSMIAWMLNLFEKATDKISERYCLAITYITDLIKKTTFVILQIIFYWFLDIIFIYQDQTTYL